MAFWGVYVKAEEPYTLTTDCEGRRLRISQATLGEKCEVESSRSVLQCTVGNKAPIPICSLSMKERHSSPLNLEFEEFEDVVFSVVGSQGIYLAVSKYYDRKTSEQEENIEKKMLGTTKVVEIAKGEAFVTEAAGNEDRGLCYTEDTEKEKDKNLTTTDVEMEEKNTLSAIEKDIRDISSFHAGNVYPSQGDSFIDDIGLQVQPSMQEHLKVNKKTKTWKSGSKGLNRKQSTEGDGDRRQQKRKTEKNSSSGVQGVAECKRGSCGTLGRGEKDTWNHLTIIGEPQGLVGTVGVDANSDLKTCNYRPKDKESQRKKKKKKKTEQKDEDFSGEIVIQELAKGKSGGKIASQGKKVKIMYTAWIKESGKIIESNSGQAPSKFQLGDEEIIEGWNVGVEGMRVGDKRRLFLPPSMGSWRIDKSMIPPDSCLAYDIELVGVH